MLLLGIELDDQLPLGWLERLRPPALAAAGAGGIQTGLSAFADYVALKLDLLRKSPDLFS